MFLSSIYNLLHVKTFLKRKLMENILLILIIREFALSERNILLIGARWGCASIMEFFKSILQAFGKYAKLK